MASPVRPEECRDIEPFEIDPKQDSDISRYGLSWPDSLACESNGIWRFVKEFEFTASWSRGAGDYKYYFRLFTLEPGKPFKTHMGTNAAGWGKMTDNFHALQRLVYHSQGRSLRPLDSATHHILVHKTGLLISAQNENDAWRLAIHVNHHCKSLLLRFPTRIDDLMLAQHQGRLSLLGGKPELLAPPTVILPEQSQGPAITEELRTQREGTTIDVATRNILQELQDIITQASQTIGRDQSAGRPTNPTFEFSRRPTDGASQYD